ncbi:MAG: hypothetical protein SOW59_04075 [Corynebacterium sp.]|nr:hypothetical protein [Corynebacterium sp.]
MSNSTGNTLYVRTVLTIPGAGQAIHIAQLREQGSDTCHLEKMIALAPDESIVGAATPTATHGNIDKPSAVVPHPALYDQFPDITAEYIEEKHFTALWAEAQGLLSGLSD